MDKNTIEFLNFNIQEGNITFLVRDNLENVEREFPSYLRLNRPVIPSETAIAAALFTLCRRNYAHIYVDLTVENTVCEKFSRACRTQINTKATFTAENKAFRINHKPQFAINFSGGFDSMSALCLLPEDVYIMSIDFQECDWLNERAFFSKFNPYIVETNLRGYGFRPYIGSMGLASILYRDTLSIDCQLFGSIMESTTSTIQGALHDNVGPFWAYGLKSARFIRGLSEVATTLILVHYKPEIIRESLNSLSSVGTEKRYRKQVLVQLAAEILGQKVEIDLVDPPETKMNFGAYFTSDFLSLYFVKKLGREAAHHHLRNIPEEAVALADELSFSFYEKYNPSFLPSVPQELRPYFMARLMEANIFPYDEKDWYEFRKVLEFLSQYHPKLKEEPQYAEYIKTTNTPSRKGIQKKRPAVEVHPD